MGGMVVWEDRIPNQHGEYLRENCDKLKEKQNDPSNSKGTDNKKKVPDSYANKSSPPALSFAAKIQDLMQE